MPTRMSIDVPLLISHGMVLKESKMSVGVKNGLEIQASLLEPHCSHTAM